MLGSLSQQVGNSLVATKVAETIKAVLTSPDPGLAFVSSVKDMGQAAGVVLGCLAVFCPSSLRGWMNERANQRQQAACRERLDRIAAILDGWREDGAEELLAIARRETPVWARLGGADQAELARRVRDEVELLLKAARADDRDFREWCRIVAEDTNDRVRQTHEAAERIERSVERLTPWNFAGSWRVEERSRWREAVNGVQFQPCRVTHAEMGREANGKCYDLASVRDLPAAVVDASLRRHIEVLTQVGRHPNLPTLIDAFYSPDRAYFWIIEAWEGDTTLAATLSQGPLIDVALHEVLRGVFRGLEALHGAGVIRRALRPENVILRAADQTPILTDLEMCKLLTHGTTVSPRRGWRDDPYLAPEVRARASTLGPEADWYSLAACAAACVIGTVDVPDHPAELRAILAGCNRVPPVMARLVDVDPDVRAKAARHLGRGLENWT